MEKQYVVVDIEKKEVLAIMTDKEVMNSFIVSIKGVSNPNNIFVFERVISEIKDMEEDKDEHEFYIVVSNTTDYPRPKRYNTYEQALNEASHYARKYTGTKFIILVPIVSVIKKDLEIKKIGKGE